MQTSSARRERRREMLIVVAFEPSPICRRSPVTELPKQDTFADLDCWCPTVHYKMGSFYNKGLSYRCCVPDTSQGLHLLLPNYSFISNKLRYANDNLVSVASKGV